jgi:hypothetical protein
LFSLALASFSRVVIHAHAVSHTSRRFSSCRFPRPASVMKTSAGRVIIQSV